MLIGAGILGYLVTLRPSVEALPTQTLRSSKLAFIAVAAAENAWLLRKLAHEWETSKTKPSQGGLRQGARCYGSRQMTLTGKRGSQSFGAS